MTAGPRWDARWLCLACLASASACSRGLDGFACPASASCGVDQACIDGSCAGPDPACPSSMRWDESAGPRSGMCTSDGGEPDAEEVIVSAGWRVRVLRELSLDYAYDADDYTDLAADGVSVVYDNEPAALAALADPFEPGLAVIVGRSILEVGLDGALRGVHAYPPQAGSPNPDRPREVVQAVGTASAPLLVCAGSNGAGDGVFQIDPQWRLSFLLDDEFMPLEVNNCDAVMVDHAGQFGAAGAPQVYVASTETAGRIYRAEDQAVMFADAALAMRDLALSSSGTLAMVAHDPALSMEAVFDLAAPNAPVTRVPTAALARPRFVSGDLSANIGADKVLEYHEDAWLGFSIYFPESHVFATGSNKFGVGLHEIQRAERNYCDAGGGPLGIGEVGDTFKLHVRYAASLSDCKNGIYERTSYALGKIPKGKWTDFVVHYQLCARPAMFGCTPYAQVWMNGELVADHKGPIGDAGTETGATKMTYKFDAPTYYAHHENTGDYDRPKGVYYIYADNVRLAKGKNAYELVDPSQGAQDPVDDSQFASLLGAPSINTGTEQKLFVWKADGKFTVLGSAGGGAVTYRGYIEADRVLTIANRAGIESTDTVRLIDGGKTLEFVLKVSGSGKDAFTFSAPSGATVRLDLTSHGAAKVRTGKDKQTIGGLPLLLHAP